MKDHLKKLLAAFGFTILVYFPTQISGSSLDPVINEAVASCSVWEQLSNHYVLLNKIDLKSWTRRGTMPRDQADWQSIHALIKVLRENVLIGYQTIVQTNSLDNL